MSVRFTTADTDPTSGKIVVDQGDLTVGELPAVGTIQLEVGENFWVSEFKNQIERAIEMLGQVLREAQWPDGAAAVQSAHFVTLANADTKTKAVLANGAATPVLTEDAILFAYNLGAGGESSGQGGPGSSVNRGSAIAAFFDKVREDLLTIPVVPGG